MPKRTLDYEKDTHEVLESQSVHSLARTIRSLRRTVHSYEQKNQHLEYQLRLTSQRSLSPPKRKPGEHHQTPQEQQEQQEPQEPQEQQEDEGGGGGGGGAPDTVVTEYDDRSIVYIYCGLEVANHRKLFFLTKSTTGFYKVIRTYLSRLQIPNNVFQTNLLDTDHKNLQVIEVLNTNNVHGVSVEIEHMHNTNNFTTWYHIRFEEFADIDRLYRYWYPSRS